MNIKRLADLVDCPFRPTDEKQLPKKIGESLSGNLADLSGTGKPIGRSALNALGLKFSHTPQPEAPEEAKEEPMEKSGANEVLPEEANPLSLPDLFLELAKRNFSAYEARCVFTLLAEGEVTPARIIELTGLRRQHVGRALRSLDKRRIAIKSEDVLSLNRCVEDWDGPIQVSRDEDTEPGKVQTEPKEVQREPQEVRDAKE